MNTTIADNNNGRWIKNPPPITFMKREIIQLPPNTIYKKVKDNTLKDEIVVRTKMGEGQKKMFSLLSKLSHTERMVIYSIICHVMPLAIILIILFEIK